MEEAREPDRNPCPPTPHVVNSYKTPKRPSSSTQNLLRDVSNFKTPKYPPSTPNLHSPAPQFFTASKQTPTPSSSFRRKTQSSRKLKQFQLEQSKSSRKAEIQKQKSLQTLSNSLSVWLNFLFRNPKSCGCHDLYSLDNGDLRGDWPGGGVGFDGEWRNPKRFRDLSWRNVSDNENDPELSFSASSKTFSFLRNSLNEVCSLDDLLERMRSYLSIASCKEVMNVMSQVAKTIDDGRLKMKAHCPIVTDFGMKEKAVKVVMCYNPIWLRIGIYIIFGGDSLLPNEDVTSDREIGFLKTVIDNIFFSHAGLAKSYAYNRKVEGLYRPGYFESLGNVILKRFLLLVLILDRAKSQSSLPLNHGIDGIDGGSPLLFTLKSDIKSSRHVVHDFLSTDVMHGEGNLLTHLVTIGYRVYYQQSPLIEYDFRVTNLFEDLQDGIRLSRAIQLLLHDSSILVKLIVPSDTSKKSLANCGVAMQYLKLASVPLHEADGTIIEAEDITTGEKELTISLLWNVFVHLQLPLLIDKTLLVEEINKIRRNDLDILRTDSSSYLEMILNWIQAISEKYDFKIDNFASLVDGKAMWCLLDFYFRKELHCPCSYKDLIETTVNESVVSRTDYGDAVHNFILSQKLTSLLGNFPEVLQTSDILEHNGPCNERSVVILLVFLSSELLVKKNMDQLNFHKLLGCTCQAPDRKRLSSERAHSNSKASLNQEVADGKTEDSIRKFKALQAWWNDMCQQNHKVGVKGIHSTMQLSSTCKQSINIQQENAARIIQSRVRQFVVRHRFLKMKKVTCLLQTVVRAWLNVRGKLAANLLRPFEAHEIPCNWWKPSELFKSYYKLMVDRHSFVKLRRSVCLIQQVARIWIKRRCHSKEMLSQEKITADTINGAILIQKYFRGWTARSSFICRIAKGKNASFSSGGNQWHDNEIQAAEKIQLAWRKYTVHKSFCIQQAAAAKIQSQFCAWLIRKRFLNQKCATIKIQKDFLKRRSDRVANRSAIIIQSHIRRWLVQKEVFRYQYCIVVIQSCARSWLLRRRFLIQKEAALRIQSAWRCQKFRKAYLSLNNMAIDIQRFVRGQICRTRLLGSSRCHLAALGSGISLPLSRPFISCELRVVLCAIVMLQKWWRGILLHKVKKKSAIIIQSCFRAWSCRQKASRERNQIVLIQAHLKGFLARKELNGQLRDLRFRVQKSARNVDDSKRIMNKLVVALSELLGMKSVSGILHTCVTLDMATMHSQKCCEKLAAAGAVGTLLKLIKSVSQSKPDQEVRKHALSTLRNLSRYPHLVNVITETPKSLEVILLELKRNKDEGYFIASELLKKLCCTPEGLNIIRSSEALLKWLRSLSADLKRKIGNEKSNARGSMEKEKMERRLKEVVELLKLTATS